LRVQGKNLRGAWCDEIGLWKRWQTAWDESLRFAVRKAPAKIIATGTPKRAMPAIRLVRRLVDDERVVKTVLRTADNAANLDAGTLEELMLLSGSALGMQELEGAVLDDDGGGYFRASDWRYWELGHQEGRRFLHLNDENRRERYLLDDCARFITIDLAASIKTSADWTVASAWAIPDSGDLILLDRVRDRVTEVDHAEFVRDLRARWLSPYDVVHVEATMQSSTLAHQLGRDGVPWAPLRADKGKLERALPYVKLTRQHRVWLPAGAEWLPEWIDEHSEFPNEGQVPDDQVDTGGYAARVRIAHWVAPEDAVTAEARRMARPDPDDPLEMDFFATPM
jgi:predicted phage terminase large subunit-like protein